MSISAQTSRASCSLSPIVATVGWLNIALGTSLWSMARGAPR